MTPETKVEGFYATYDFGFEGAITVYITLGPHHTLIVAIPRLGLSTLLMNDSNDENRLRQCLGNHPLYQRNLEERDLFARAILDDIGKKV